MVACLATLCHHANIFQSWRVAFGCLVSRGLQVEGCTHTKQLTRPYENDGGTEPHSYLLQGPS